MFYLVVQQHKNGSELAGLQSWSSSEGKHMQAIRFTPSLHLLLPCHRTRLTYSKNLYLFVLDRGIQPTEVEFGIKETYAKLGTLEWLFLTVETQKTTCAVIFLISAIIWYVVMAPYVVGS